MRQIRLVLGVLVLVWMGATVVHGQVSGGPKIGVLFPSYYGMGTVKEASLDQKLFFSFHAGGELLVQLPLPGLEFEADLLFSRRGTCFVFEGEKSPVREELRERYYLDLPLRINYSVGLARTGFFVGIGPTVSMAVIARNRIEDRVEKVGIGYGATDVVPRWDVALGAQLGIRFNGIQLSGSFDWGFLPVERSVLNGYYTTYYGGLSLAYLF